MAKPCILLQTNWQMIILIGLAMPKKVKANTTTVTIAGYFDILKKP